MQYLSLCTRKFLKFLHFFLCRLNVGVALLRSSFRKELLPAMHVEEQEDTKLHVAIADDDGFSDDVDEPLAGKRIDPVAAPYVAETSVPMEGP